MSVLLEFQREVGGWGEVTFPQSHHGTVLSHFLEEALELYGVRREKVGVILELSGIWQDQNGIIDPVEAADCFLLLIHLAHKLGFDLMDTAQKKMEINRARTWSATPEPGGHTKHVEEG